MSTYEDIWYAARSTQIVYMPPKLLETFGESRIHYLVLSEEMDQPSAIRLRSGIVTAERPRIVTPTYFKQKSVENFGEDARKYFDEVLSKDVNARFVEYGLKFGKQEFKEELAHGNVREIAEQAAAEAQDELDKLSGVVIGFDNAWEISLMRFITELVQRSLPFNARDIAKRGLFSLDDGVPKAVIEEIEDDFNSCSTLDAAKALGTKLREYGLFNRFEDRFFDLYRKLK